jgi:hypothetical protein
MKLDWKQVLHWAVPDRDECGADAAKLAADHPSETPAQLVRRIIDRSVAWGAAAGGATGAAANPLVMFPAAVADVAAMLRIEGHMAGTIAAVMDPASLDRPGAFEADVLSIVFPGAVSQALRQIGIRAGQQVTKNLVRKYLGEQFVQNVTRLTARYLFVKFSQKAVLTKSVPLVGAGIGAGWNWLEVQAVGRRAVRYFEGRGVGPRAPHALPDRTAVRKLLPWLGKREDPAIESNSTDPQ